MSVIRRKVIVIGGGAAGIAAAIEAAKNAEVTVLEHMETPLKKILITGNGRCNFTNSDVSAAHYYGDVNVIESVLSSFSVDDCLDLMRECHVEPLEVHYRFNDCGYFYPSSNKAETVRNGMLSRFSELGGKILCGVNVQAVSMGQEGILVRSDKGDFAADRLIFACGSNAAPETGSDSSIYPVLKKLDVAFHTFLPALCGIKVSDGLSGALTGMRCTAAVTLIDQTEEKEYSAEPGEVQFGNGYVSGIPVMHLSRYVSIGRKKEHQMILRIVPSAWENVRKDAKVFPASLELLCTGTRGFSHAQCCLGGVDAGELVPETLCWKRNENIYFCGEMIDVDGDCGGFNLHFAFGSGKLAGRKATT